MLTPSCVLLCLTCVPLRSHSSSRVAITVFVTKYFLPCITVYFDAGLFILLNTWFIFQVILVVQYLYLFCFGPSIVDIYNEEEGRGG